MYTTKAGVTIEHRLIIISYYYHSGFNWKEAVLQLTQFLVSGVFYVIYGGIVAGFLLLAVEMVVKALQSVYNSEGKVSLK